MIKVVGGGGKGGGSWQTNIRPRSRRTKCCLLDKYVWAVRIFFWLG